jgi:hypothetical protein
MIFAPMLSPTMKWIYIEETPSPMGYKDPYLITIEGDFCPFVFVFIV